MFLDRIFKMTAHAHTSVLILLILLLSAIPRFFLLKGISDDMFYHNDGAEYMEISRQIALGNGFSLSYYRWHEPVPPDAEKGKTHPDLARTPLFPLLGAGLFFLPWNVTYSAKVLSLILSLVAVFCVFLLGREFAGRSCGLWSALIFALYPYAIYYASSWSTENLFLILLALSMLFLLKFLRGSFSAAGWCGAFLSAAALTRPTAVILPVFFAGILLFRFSITGAMKWKKENLHFPRTIPGRLWKGAAVFLLTFILILFPWTYRNRQLGGSWNPSTYYDGYVFWLSFSEILHETYRTLDTPEYSAAVDQSWKTEHEKYHKLLREKKIYSFIEAGKQWKQWGWEQIRRSPEKALWLLRERFLHYWRMCPNLVILRPWQIILIRIYFTILFILALAGVFRMLHRLELTVALLPILFGMVVSIPFLFVLRYRYPFFAPYISILAGTALAWIEMTIKNKLHGSDSKP